MCRLCSSSTIARYEFGLLHGNCAIAIIFCRSCFARTASRCFYSVREQIKRALQPLSHYSFTTCSRVYLFLIWTKSVPGISRRLTTQSHLQVANRQSRGDGAHEAIGCRDLDTTHSTYDADCLLFARTKCRFLKSKFVR